MQKIPTLFERDWTGDRSRVLDKVNAEAAWVLAGKGVATRKRDGTACLLHHGVLSRRYDMKPGREVDSRWIAAQEPQFLCDACRWSGGVPIGQAQDFGSPKWNDIACPGCGKATRFNHWPGWLPCDPSRAEDRWHYAAALPTEDGTYELCGPKINGNPERLERHEYFRHSAEILTNVPWHYGGIRDYLADTPVEGIVWHHHQDGRMAKIKARDFVIRWPR